MPPKSSKNSVVSVDPVVVSHIIGGTKPSSSTARGGHARAESTPARSITTTISANAQAKNHGRTKSSNTPLRDVTKRSNSLRRVKDSTEILKSKSLASAKAGSKSPEPADVKRGRTFTVTNVGTGGLLHLRPSSQYIPFSPPVSSPAMQPWVSPALTAAQATTQPETTQRTRSVSPRRALGLGWSEGKPSVETRRQHVRSQSFSTVNESRKSVQAAKPKAFKIVINRPDSTSSIEDVEQVPTLDIAIPNYKLGRPRFSTHGTPFLRSSSYTRASAATTTDCTSISEIPVEGYPPNSFTVPNKWQGSAPSDESVIPMPHPLRVNKSLFRPLSGTSSNPPAPIQPELYDDLARVYDHPAIVRYSENSTDISAATKVRIIAQISSESFMDYELVSDFFLTFRLYMTTFEVLDLLLARLKWAVGRLSEDGRIIRIRTFAALRHWILNYFTEDFVVNRRLRLRFCHEVNELYESVRARSKTTGGKSDLKILQDLKRCWNGRCSLFWDAEEFNMDSSPDSPLLPGGVIGSRNPAFTDLAELYPIAAANVHHKPTVQPSPLLSPTSRGIRAVHHKRLPSSENAKKPTNSVGSDGSIQPGSCSIPKSRSRPSAETPSPPLGPQPVSVLARRQKAPADLKVATHTRGDSKSSYHKRSEGSIDSSRQSTPVDHIIDSGQFIDPHAGSIIRGFVYGPVEPFVHLPANPPLSPAVRFDVAEQASVVSRPNASSPSVNQTPAVKNIFGSIRRALSGKQGSGEVAVITVSHPRQDPTTWGKKSPMPMHVARSQDDLRRKVVGAQARGQLRIDLLCAAAVESFQAAVPGVAAPTIFIDDQPASAPLPSAPFSPPLSQPDDQYLAPAARVPSQYTSRSGSILIVDDTGSEMPVMSGALGHSYTHGSADGSSENVSDGSLAHIPRASFETQIAFQDDYSDSRSGHSAQPSEKLISLLPPAELRKPGVASPASSVITIRHEPATSAAEQGDHDHASTQGSMRTSSPPAMTEATSGSESPIIHAPTQALRRRPGGDLRKNQNVQELSTHQHHESLDSMLDPDSSHGESLLIMGTPPHANHHTPPKQPEKKKISMINTHSSQQLRQSFSAAISGFSSIPDDDDGGLEATLRKLEGDYSTPSPNAPMSHTTSPQPDTEARGKGQIQAKMEQDVDVEAGPGRSRAGGLGMNGLSFLHDAEPEADAGAHESRRFAHVSPVFGLPVESVAGSDDEDEGDSGTPSFENGPLRSAPAPKPMHELGTDPTETTSEQQVVNMVYQPGLPIPAPNYDLPPRPNTALTDGATSFLLDDGEASDLSSEISVDIVNYSDVLGKSVSPMLAAPGTAISGLEIPSHPLTHASVVDLSMHPSPVLMSRPSQQTQLPTPEPSPTSSQNAFRGGSASVVRPQPSVKFEQQPKAKMSAGPAHIPFILACDSQMLAQQFTIVEQSALTEIEWTDLVEMRWNNKSTTTHDWAEYMAKHEDARGIDVVIARFNLVVKWALSEIVLTQDVEERARVISKLIHVAAHARRLRNYATMLQITIALTSTDCTRLKRTWEHVSSPDRSLLKNMEVLVQPIRNFHDLRVEMESTDLTDGCIPFIGLYVHDLTYNAQKPGEIIFDDDAEPLVNFERFRTAAIIIKGLLRLIDASLSYAFEPIHGVIERCLWISALSDNRIHALSKELEH